MPRKQSQKFSLGAVVSAHSGRLACDMGELYGILSYMLGDNLMTHQLPAASREVAPKLEEAFPWLSTLTLPEGGVEAFTEAIKELESAYGKLLEVPTYPEASWRRGNQLQDLGEMFSGPIIGVVVEDAPKEEADEDAED